MIDLEDPTLISEAYQLTGREMRERRNEMRISQKTLARQMCVHAQSISDWECGRRSITPAIGRLFWLTYALTVPPKEGEE